MKLFFLLALIFLPLGFAHARLGETEDECAKRFGSVIKTGEVDGQKTNDYQAGDYIVEVRFEDGKSLYESYSRADKAPIPDDVMQKLLDAQKGSLTWSDLQRVNMTMRWTRSDGAMAMYLVTDSRLLFFTKSYLDEQNVLAAKEAQAKQDAVKGF